MSDVTQKESIGGPTTGGEKTKLSAHDRLDWTVLSAGLSSGYGTSRYEKMKDKLDDEIKLAGLESSVPEEFEKHLILN